ncbi:MAG: FAD:protein FMN transferase [Pseudomonadota bacterium]
MLRALVGIAISVLSACEAPSESIYRTISGQTMGTYYRVEAECSVLTPAALEAELARVNTQMSNYDPGSQLSRLNGAPVDQWLNVDPELVSILRSAQTLHKASDGALEITIAPVLRLWGFGPGAADVVRAPAIDDIRRALERVDQGLLEWRTEPNPQLRRRGPVEVDLSAIAKGHGVDRLAEVIEAQGCRNYLVDIGGEVRASGRNARGGGWIVGIEVPDPRSVGAVQRLLSLQTGAVATSGDYRNFIEAADTGSARSNWSHTIDPRTGSPVTHSLASVTVIAEQAAVADGWATALLVLGPVAGWARARELGLAAIFILRTETGFVERYTESAVAYLVAPPSPVH